MASRLALSASARLPGLVMIQLVTTDDSVDMLLTFTTILDAYRECAQGWQFIELIIDNSLFVTQT